MPSLRLFHGTTRAAGERIMGEGFAPLDLDAALATVAAMVGVDEDELRGVCVHLYAVVGRRADGKVSFARHRGVAWGYAGQDGGETRREMLAAALRLADPALGAAGAERVAKRRLRAPAAVVYVDAPFEAVEASLERPRMRQKPWTYEEWVEFEGSFGERVSRLGHDAGLETPIPREWVAGMDEVEMPVSLADVALRFGLPAVVAEELVRSGPLPLNGLRGAPGPWPESEIISWLAERGLSESDLQVS